MSLSLRTIAVRTWTAFDIICQHLGLRSTDSVERGLNHDETELKL